MRFAYIQKAMLYGLLKERFDTLRRPGGSDGFLRVKGELDRARSSGCPRSTPT